MLAILRVVDRLDLGVEVDNARYVPLLSLASRTNGRLPLTTIAPRQRRAIVKISVLKNGRPTVVDKMQVTDIALGMHEHPQIDLEGHHDGRGHVALTLYLDGKRYSGKTVDVSRFLPRRSRSAWLVAVVAAVLLASVGGLTYLLIQGDFGAVRQPTDAQRSAESTAKAPQRSADDAGRGAGEETGEVLRGDTRPSGAAGADAADAAAGGVSGPGADTEDGGGMEREQATADAQPRRPSFAGPVDDVIPPSASDPVVVYFLPNSSAILPEVRSRLSRLFGVLRRYPDHRLVIEGHCAIAGSEAGRAEISENRARNVRDVLAELGWEFDDGSRVVGLGATDPETTDESLQYLNRRVEIWALPPVPQ